MEQVWLSIAAQVPIVVAFILFTLRIIQMFLIAIEKRDALYLATLGEIVKAVNQLALAIQSHDLSVKENWNGVDERRQYDERRAGR